MSQQQQSVSKRKKVELILHQLNSLPTLPVAAARILQLTVQTDTQAAEVVRLIESDPSLATKIVGLATRANTGLNRRSASLSKAVVLLGFDAVRNAVLSIKVFETLGGPAQGQTGQFDRVGFWKHSLAVACAAKMLAKHVDAAIDEEEAFVCGLLHDIGKMAFDAAMPKSFARIVEMTESSLANIADVERKVLGIDHTVAGKRLAQRWKLPPVITETVWLHHQWPDALPHEIAHRSVVQTVHLANLLARRQRIGYSGNHSVNESAEAVAEQLGCPADALEAVARGLGETISERAELLGLNDVEPEQLYHEALGQANNELGRLNDRLRQHNEKLNLRSRYFNLIGRLNEGLQPDQSVVDVCSLIAGIWRNHTRAEQCAVYVLTPDESIVEGAVSAEAADKPTVFFVDYAEDARSAGAADDFPAGFSVGPVGSSHQWFFEQVCPHFDIAATLAMPLRTGSDLAGGVLWQQAGPEPDYGDSLNELHAWAASCALAVRQAQRQDKQSRLCEQLAQVNHLLHQSQQRLLQKQALASVGEMACGAAHEINNPLAVVVGRSELLASTEDDPKRRETLQLIAKNGREMSNIVSELLEVSKPQHPKRENVRVADIVAAALERCKQQGEERNVGIEAQLEEDMPEVQADGEQIAAAISELVSNGIESYQGRGGTVRLTGRYDEVNDEVVLEVSDHGCGMDEQTLRKAFDPFFSARPAGRGRGLGLSRAMRQVESNGGRLLLQSRPQEGCVARLVLRAAEAVAPNETVAC